MDEPRSTRPKNWVSHHGLAGQATGENVLQAGYRRIHESYENADDVVVSFSGGKDSTVMLHMALDVAKERGRLPLKVVFFDEELLDPDTLDFTAQVRSWPEVDFYWYCIPVRHTLRSEFRVWWWPWDLEEKEVWARPKPDFADEFPGDWVKGETGVPEASQQLFREMDWGKCAQLVGIRIQESFNRRRAIMAGGSVTDRGAALYVKPIFDWGWQDVWYFIQDRGVEYSKFYDKCFMAGITPHWQRVAPWGNVAQSRNVTLWSSFYPDFWDAAVKRLPELRAQARYGASKLFRQVMNKPDGMTWQEFTWALIAGYKDEETREFWTHYTESALRKWTKKNSIPFPDEPVMVDGYGLETLQCWKRIASVVSKNDRFGRDKT